MDAELQSPHNIASPGPVRLCGFCHKPFLNETSYNRHVLYCRRAKNRPRTRVRSCRSCTKAKRKCSGQLRCQRCTHKSLECVYDNTTSTAAAAAPAPARESTQVAITKPQPAESLTPLAEGHVTDSLDQSCAPGGTTDTDSAQISIDWDCLEFAEADMLLQSPNLNLPSCSHPHLEPALSAMLDGPPLQRGNHDVVDPLDSIPDPENWLLPTQLPWSAQNPPDGHLSALTGPVYVAERPYSDFLVPVPILDPVSKCTANVVMQMLCAFPQMMLRRETFPPFIHGHWYCPSSATASALPKPLVNCMGLAQIFASHNVETRSFLWRTVREEQRFSAEKARLRQFSKHDHLAALQALLIYIMMRVVDNSKIELDLNLELLVTYQGLCDSFKDLCNEPFYHHERLCPSSSWQEWIFAESRRRTAIVWLLVTQMVQIKIGVPCDRFTSFRDVPLSSPKSLWEAKSRSAWEAEYDVYRTMPRMGLDVFGDLYDACKQSSVVSNKLKLHAWNATVDNLGILLNLGAEIM